MTTGRCILIGLALSLTTAGCASPENAPLVFFQAHTLGITANASGSQATPEVTLGYRDVDVALVPLNFGGSVTEKGAKDAYSVFGQFDAGAGAGAGAIPTANLGKFFATGLAARNISDGFAEQLRHSTKIK